MLVDGSFRRGTDLLKALILGADAVMVGRPVAWALAAYGAEGVQWVLEMMQEELVRIWEATRKTVLFVTHSIEEAVYVSDRIVLLSPRPGRVDRVIDLDIPREGDPEAIRRDPVYLDTVEHIWQGLKRYVE